VFNSLKFQAKNEKGQPKIWVIALSLERGSALKANGMQQRGKEFGPFMKRRAKRRNHIASIRRSDN